jgi:hypothetical protein
VPTTNVRRACVEAVEIADAGGSRFSQIFASYHLATAHFLDGDYRAAEEQYAEAFAQARAAGTALDWLSLELAVCADSCLARGDADTAIATAGEAMAAADAGGAWFQAAVARAAAAEALVRAGAAKHDIAAVIADARELVPKSGGDSLLPRLREADARLAGRDHPATLEAGLRDAEAMYRVMGAPDPAARLAAELGVRR